MALKLELDRDKNFRDPIHGFIGVHEHELKIIEDPIFQRLRRIKQLSFGYYVYHGADHSRFGHSLGAMHLAERALQSIEDNTKKYGKPLKFSKEDRFAVRLAALLHDVGHKPFSHALDQTFCENHEKYSSLLVEEWFAPLIEAAGVNSELVAALIEGKADPTRNYLTYLIDGEMDVDRLDFVARDSYYAGVKYGAYDLERLLETLFVDNNKLAVLTDGSYAATQLIFARYFMYEQVYLHRTKRAFEGMANLLASHLLKDKKIYYPKVKDLRKKKRIEEFVAYDDAWFLRGMFQSRSPDYRRLAKDLAGRHHFKEIYNSFEIRRRLSKRGDGEASEQAATDFLKPLEVDIKEKQASLGIEDGEMVFDEYYNLPYRLRPYGNPLPHENQEEARTIYVFDTKTAFLERIESTYPLIEHFAKNHPKIKRLFVHSSKEERLREFLRKKYSDYFT